jgi:hypothetical protein
MDEQTEKKIRDLKLKIHTLEKEQTQSQYTMNRGAFLRAGHAGQIARNADKDRARIQEKIDELRAKLEELTGPTEDPAPAPAAEPEQEKAATKAAAKKK